MSIRLQSLDHAFRRSFAKGPGVRPGRFSQVKLPSLQRLLPWLGVLLIVTVALICAVVGWLLRDSRLQALRSASTEAANLSAAITQDIARNIEFFDLSIQGALDDMKNPAVMSSPEDLRRLILFDRAATAPYLGGIFVTDETGRITIDSRGRNTKNLSLRDRDYFKVQAEHSDVGLYIGSPVVSRVDGERFIALSRRISKPDGSFGGIVVGSIHLAYFQQLFSKFSLGARGSLTLFRDDGVVLMREPYKTALVGRVVRPSWLFDRLAVSHDGEIQAKSSIDGEERLYHYSRIGQLPLVQDVALSIKDIYADWWRKAIGILAVLGFCCAIILSLAFWLRKELRGRIKAEAALLLLASEDSLTGLANRRRLDEALTKEWALGLRHKWPVSLLLIDADQFKGYNDALGHSAGDAALVALGKCLKAKVRRPSDLSARFGGEEFAVVLPLTDQNAAFKVAEAIRNAVLDLALPHPGSDIGVFSVSIGIATFVPDANSGSADLIMAADAALYASKREGRNRCTSHAAPM